VGGSAHGLTLERCDGPEEALDRAGAFLVAREAEHNVLLGLLANLQAGFYPGPRYLGIVRRDEAVVAFALRAGRSLVLSCIDDSGAIPLIVSEVLVSNADIPGVGGPKSEALAFATEWAARSGGSFVLERAERIYRLTRVIPPAPVAGRIRVAGAADASLLREWFAAFSEEALGTRAEPAEVDELLQRRLPRRELWLWEDGAAVSMAGVSGPTPNGIRVNAVYTPPANRGRGYASACVAALSQAQLDAGKRYCFLYTDLANSTSNRIYQRIGYEPVADVDDYRFQV
jgi:GNAT superfamily N-acetyltransferase